MTLDVLMDDLGYVSVIAPAVLLAVIGLPMLLGRPLNEKTTARATQIAVVIGLLSSIAVLIMMLMEHRHHQTVKTPDWVHLDNEHFNLHISFVFDRLSVPFVILSYVLVGTIGAFASRYLHRESGYNR